MSSSIGVSQVIFTAIRTLLRDISALNDVPITWQAGTDVTSVPYIRMSLMTRSGEENYSHARSFDIPVTVEAYGLGNVQIVPLAGYIHSIVGKYPVFIDGWQAWSPITNIGLSEPPPIVKQNEQLFGSGGIYRIRGVRR